MAKTWWLVVRHSPDYVDESGKVYPYPPDGVGILAYDDEQRAKLYAANSTNGENRYEAIQVSEVNNDTV